MDTKFVAVAQVEGVGPFCTTHCLLLLGARIPVLPDEPESPHV